MKLWLIILLGVGIVLCIASIFVSEKHHDIVLWTGLFFLAIGVGLLDASLGW